MNSTKTGLRRSVGAGLEQMSVTVPVTAALLHTSDRVVARTRRGDRELGASAVEWVVITALLVTMVLAVGVTLYNKITAKATDLDLTTP